MADFLTRRGDRYYFQRAVPLHLQPRVGKKLWRTSLGDCSRRDAQRRARSFIDETDAIIDCFDRLDPERLDAISAELGALGVDIAPSHLSPELATERLSAARDDALYTLCESVWSASKPLQAVLDQGDMLTVLAAGKPSGMLRSLAASVVATVEAARAIPAELRGEARTKPKSIHASPLEDLHGRWSARSDVTPQTAAEALTTVRRFTELHGSLPLREISREHCRRFRAAMLDMPRVLTEDLRKSTLPDLLKGLKGQSYDRVAPVTARKRLTFLKAILAFGVEEGELDESPAAGLAIKAGTEGEERKPFAPEELEKLFGALADKGERNSLFWVSVLLLATGARAGEIIPLESKDITFAGEIPIINIISDVKAGRRLKTKHSARSVPVHPDLVALGFIEFARSRSGRLFPELGATKTGKFSSYFSQIWMRWLRGEVGITDPSKTLHSLRHSFKSLARRAGVPEDVHDAVTGHRPATVGRAYGDYPVEQLGREMAKIRLPQSLMLGIKAG